MTPPSPPRATARLQFHPRFALEDAISLVPYFAQLGISHLYASPLLKARRGSPHGYDVVDHAAINPELGGRAALERLVEVLHRHGMGLVLDIVPNHMAADAAENAWWRDVLARGRASPYASFFDIDWSSPEPGLRGKVLLPVLGRPYAEALAAGEIRLERDAANGAAEIVYFTHRFPLAAGTAFPANTPEALHMLLEAQHYRLATWFTAADAINWRRFFDINGLVALRAERADVFAATHALILELFAAGLIDGVRVDHVDGLADPRTYCRRLRAALMHRRTPHVRPYIIVEKILMAGEALPADWEVDGTTGYDFMAEVAGVQHDPAGAVPLARLWERVTGSITDFAAEERRARAETLACSFTADAARVTRALWHAHASARAARDMPQAALGRIVAAVAGCFPAYRTYLDAAGASPADAALIERALAAAEPLLCAADRRLLGWFREILLLPCRNGAIGRRRREVKSRFQQLTATLAAKAVEDTAFYRYGPLLSRNEVGASPAFFAVSAAELHAACAARQARFPHALLATATHDHKRGEDVRARLAVLSEIPGEWAARVESWMRRNAERKERLATGAAPVPVDELMLYQTMVAAWPAALAADDEVALAVFAGRVAAWQEKALREARQRSSWVLPNTDYEAACRAFLSRLLADIEMRHELAGFAARIGPAGAVNGLVQTMLKLTLPGVPDLYQGAEFWDESLVDPDNRRPVDFSARRAALAHRAPLSDLVGCWRNGHIKQALIARMLGLRAELPRLFATSDMVVLPAEGARAGHILAFLRRNAAASLLIAVPRLLVSLLGAAREPAIDPAAWKDTCLRLPAEAAGPWRNVLLAADPLDSAETLLLGRLFSSLPVAAWIAGPEAE